MRRKCILFYQAVTRSWNEHKVQSLAHPSALLNVVLLLPSYLHGLLFESVDTECDTSASSAVQT
ncbi:unnamed protein product [Ectocarpus sp. CCAP 1310/34]|nr:unnamed protein product [Ectocarpus sp. CCAP 1310/34]